MRQQLKRLGLLESLKKPVQKEETAQTSTVQTPSPLKMDLVTVDPNELEIETECSIRSVSEAK